MNIKIRVTLEPDLEQEAALLTSGQRRAMAAKLERWAHQLRVSAAIIEADQRPKPRPCLKRVSQRRLVLN